MSKIEWTGETWNPLLGCDKVSPGCKNCYAIRTAWIRMHNPLMQERYAGTVEKSAGGQLNWTGKVNTVEEALLKPLKTKKPTTYFVNSMSDLFHESVPFDFIDKVFCLMRVAKQHTFQVLTKRAKRMAEYFSVDRPAKLDAAYFKMMEENSDLPSWVCLDQTSKVEGWPLPNVWVGVSVENQQTAEERIPYLIDTPAAIRFLSCEPLLGRIKLWPLLQLTNNKWTNKPGSIIDWVICGGESGPGARPMHPEWARSLRDQCQSAGVPFFFKQWGEWYTRWIDISNKTDHPYVFKYYTSYEQWTQKSWVKKGDACISIDGKLCKSGGDLKECKYPVAIMQKVGKKNAGRLLDGQIHDDFPELKT